MCQPNPEEVQLAPIYTPYALESDRSRHVLKEFEPLQLISVSIENVTEKFEYKRRAAVPKIFAPEKTDGELRVSQFAKKHFLR